MGAVANRGSGGTDSIGMLSFLSELPPQTILTREELANQLHCCAKTIERMEKRLELPAPIRFQGKLRHRVSTIIDYINQCFERAQSERSREMKRLGEI